MKKWRNIFEALEKAPTDCAHSHFNQAAETPLGKHDECHCENFNGTGKLGNETLQGEHAEEGINEECKECTDWFRNWGMNDKWNQMQTACVQKAWMTQVQQGKQT